MTDNEVNKIIADFEGLTILTYNVKSDYLECYDRKNDRNITIKKYTKSLDKLVPIWQELSLYKFEFEFEPYDSIGWFMDMLDYGSRGGKELRDYRYESGDPLYLTIQQAAAHSTAKAILELQENNEE